MASKTEILDTIFDQDPTAAERKKDHIELALKARTAGNLLDNRFHYEPLMGSMEHQYIPIQFLGKNFDYPIWISSMTGGTEMAPRINRNLARLCNDFNLGMGLGSCRQLLYSDEFFKDFDVRNIIGDRPLYTNLGIAQVETLLESREVDRIPMMIQKLRADGLIIHVNPMQEWMQPEGDIIKHPPIDTIKELMNQINLPIIVKEVGQGMGPTSLKALMELPLEAIDFGAFGGTNFATLELMRQSEEVAYKEAFTYVGHTAAEMCTYIRDIVTKHPEEIKCKQIIISGGVQDYLDGYYLLAQTGMPSLFGQASAFLKHAMGDYEPLLKYMKNIAQGLDMAQAFLSPKPQQ
jgi:isopentenyl-diphosphate delta-isomerase